MPPKKKKGNKQPEAANATTTASSDAVVADETQTVDEVEDATTVELKSDSTAERIEPTTTTTDDLSSTTTTNDTTSHDVPVVRVHLMTDSALDAEPSRAPVIEPHPESTSTAYGKPDEATLGPAPGPTVQTISTQQKIEQITTTTTTTVAPTVAQPLLAPLPILTTAPTCAHNPNSPALATALATTLKQVKSDLAPSSSLDSLLIQIQSLSYDLRSKFFTLATTSSNAASHDLFRAMVAYFLDATHSGSPTDGFCKFLYDLYWEASTKMTRAAPSTELPPAHLFLLNLIPTLVYQFLSKHFSSVNGGSTTSYAGLFTVFLAVYNTERILSARSPSTSILAPAPVPQLDELKGLSSCDLFGRKSATTGSHHHPSTILPSILEPSQHTQLLLHVLLKKCTNHIPRLLPPAIETFIYLVGVATSSGQAQDIFEPIFGPDSNGRKKLGVSWSTAWRSNPSTTRFGLSSEVLQDCLNALLFARQQLTSSPSSTSPPASDSSITSLQRQFILIALRQVHCRAIDELRPEILLQTTVLLEQEEEAGR